MERILVTLPSFVDGRRVVLFLRQFYMFYVFIFQCIGSRLQRLSVPELQYVNAQRSMCIRWDNDTNKSDEWQGAVYGVSDDDYDKAINHLFEMKQRFRALFAAYFVCFSLSSLSLSLCVCCVRTCVVRMCCVCMYRMMMIIERMVLSWIMRILK